jgi:hypothetical protein
MSWEKQQVGPGKIIVANAIQDNFSRAELRFNSRAKGYPKSRLSDHPGSTTTQTTPKWLKHAFFNDA